MNDQIWRLERGAGPLVATAIHDGHDVRPELCEYLALDEADRLREEDPHTGVWTSVAPNRIIALRSRFEVDLNRRRPAAVYRTPEDAWGLRVWNADLPADLVATSLLEYDGFYAALRGLYTDLARQHGRFVVYDLHSYNHLRDGPDGPPADPKGNPQVNLGTGTMIDRSRWAPVIDRFMHDLSSWDFPGGKLDVRENVKFRGGNSASWTHATFPEAACVLSVEVKKFFMNEWTGEVQMEALEALRQAIESTAPGVIEELAKL